MNMKSSLLTLALIAGISGGASADSSRLKELMDASSFVNSTLDVVGSEDLRHLLEDCESLEKLNKKSYDCKMLGKKQLIEAVKQGVSDFNEILSAEKEAQSKAEMNEKLKDIKVAVNKAQYFMEYLDICEKLKTVKASNPNSFNECKIDTVSDCEESDIATLKPIFEECIGSGDKNSGTGTGNFSDCGVPETQKKIWNAVASGNISAFRKEVNNNSGANVNVQNCNGISLIYMAVAKQDEEMVRELIETYGINLNVSPSPICPAIDSSNHYISRLLLESRARHRIVNQDCDGTSDNVLIYAVKKHNYDVLNYILDASSSLVNNQDLENGNTAVHYAAKEQSPEALNDLLFSTTEYDSCIKNDEGKTAYDLLNDNLKAKFAKWLKCGY